MTVFLSVPTWFLYLGLRMYILRTDVREKVQHTLSRDMTSFCGKERGTEDNINVQGGCNPSEPVDGGTEDGVLKNSQLYWKLLSPTEF